MGDARLNELIQGEIDGVLDAGERAELARRLLADPAAQAEREQWRRLCGLLDRAGEADAPPELPEQILAALPQRHRPTGRRMTVPGPWSSEHRWRYAAVAATVLLAGALVFTTARGPGTQRDLAGTMAASDQPTKLDEVHLAGEAVSGRVGLYRTADALQVQLAIKAARPVDVIITAGGQTQQLRGLTGPGGGVTAAVSVPSAGPESASATVAVTVLIAGDAVGTATLRTSGRAE